jgi:hypothetical protein
VRFKRVAACAVERTTVGVLASVYAACGGFKRCFRRQIERLPGLC